MGRAMGGAMGRDVGRDVGSSQRFRAAETAPEGLNVAAPARLSTAGPGKGQGSIMYLDFVVSRDVTLLRGV